MNGYRCFYRDRIIEVHADTSLKAQEAAAAILKMPAKHQWKIRVVLCESKGQQVVHTPVD